MSLALIATSAPAEPGKCAADLFRRLFLLLDSAHVRYAVLHSWEGLPLEAASDLDLVVEPADRARLAPVFAQLEAAGYRPIQYRNYVVHGHRIDFAWVQGAELRIQGVDLVFDYRYRGLLLFSAADLLAGGRRMDEGFWVLHPAREFAYLLAKKSVKGVTSPRQARRLRQLVQDIGTETACAVARDLFGREWQSRVVAACRNGDLPDLLPDLQLRLRRMRVWRRPLNLIRYWLPEVGRAAHRMAQPAGAVFVVLGPDGAGKSTLIGRLSALHEAFRSELRFHWRPGIVRRLPASPPPVTDPHAKPPHGKLVSVLAACAVWLDYWVGYWLRIRPQLVRSALVVFDRHLCDLGVDPRRYRYDGPGWLPHWLARTAPPRDLLALVLDVDEQSVLHRKSEVSQAEVRRQAAAYRELIREWPAARLVDATAPEEAVALQALQLACDYLCRSFHRRKPDWLRLQSTHHATT